MKLKMALALLLGFCATTGHPAELKKFAPGQIHGPNMDNDIEFTLTPQEVDTLNSDAAKSTLLKFLTATLGPLGPVATAYVVEHISDVKTKAGRGGAWVKMTIRNGNELHVWDVYGLQQKTAFSNPSLQGLPVDGTTWEFAGQNEGSYNRLAASAYCQAQGYTDLDSYSLKELSTPGAWRFDNSGKGRLCDFCKKAFSTVTCAR